MILTIPTKETEKDALALIVDSSLIESRPYSKDNLLLEQLSDAEISNVLEASSCLREHLGGGEYWHNENMCLRCHLKKESSRRRSIVESKKEGGRPLLESLASYSQKAQDVEIGDYAYSVIAEPGERGTLRYYKAVAVGRSDAYTIVTWQVTNSEDEHVSFYENNQSLDILRPFDDTPGNLTS